MKEHGGWLRTLTENSKSILTAHNEELCAFTGQTESPMKLVERHRERTGHYRHSM